MRTRKQAAVHHPPIQQLARRVHLPLQPHNPVESFRIVHRKMTTPRFDMHYAAELGVVLAGRMRRYSEAETRELGRGDAWICGMWEPHGYSVGNTGAEVLVFHFLPEALIQSGPVGGIPYLAPFVGMMPRTVVQELTAKQKVALLQMARQVEPQTGTPQAAWIARNLLDIMRLLSVLLRDWAPAAAGATAHPETMRDFSRLQPVLQRLREAPAQPLALDEAAALTHLGRSRFVAVFHHTMGTTFAQYRINLILSHVAKALVQGDDKILSVAQAWGFVDGSHLTRIFKKRFGCTPAAYRARRGFR
jgi:AraC-like DNA-binding protein/quercetin dioxygenase-like cupin family protein